MACSTADWSIPAKLMVFLNLSVESDMSMTADEKPLSVSHNAVTPLSAAPPMKLPNAAALPVTFDIAFTASSALPVMRTDMMALLPMLRLLQSFHLLFEQPYGRSPVEFAGLAPPLPWRASDAM